MPFSLGIIKKGEFLPFFIQRRKAKMKRIFCLLFILTLLLTACQSNNTYLVKETTQIDLAKDSTILALLGDKIICRTGEDTNLNFAMASLDKMDEIQPIGGIDDYLISVNPPSLCKIGNSLYMMVGTGTYEEPYMKILELDLDKKELNAYPQEQVARLLGYVDHIDDNLYLLKGATPERDRYISYIDCFSPDEKESRHIIEKENVTEITDAIFSFACDQEKIYALSRASTGWQLEVYNKDGNLEKSNPMPTARDFFSEDSMPLIYVYHSYLIISDWSKGQIYQIGDDGAQLVAETDLFGFFPASSVTEFPEESILLHAEDKDFFLLNALENTITTIPCPFIETSSVDCVVFTYQDQENVLFSVCRPDEGGYGDQEYYITSIDLLLENALSTFPLGNETIRLERRE